MQGMDAHNAPGYRLDGRVAVVTGAAGGLGSVTVDRLAELGARVVLADLPRTLQQLEQRAGELGNGCLAVPCDLADEQSVNAAAQRVKEALGGCDILVNNAGILAKHTSLQAMALEDWELSMAINLRGPLLCIRAFGAGMLERGRGSIVNVGSIAAHKPNASPAYSATKAALLALTRHTAVEWGPRGIRTNSVSPGFIRTKLSEAHYVDSDLLKQREASVPMRRLGTTLEVASAVAYLASDAAGFVNGQDLIVDGGFLETVLMHAQAKADQYGGQPH